MNLERSWSRGTRCSHCGETFLGPLAPSFCFSCGSRMRPGAAATESTATWWKPWTWLRRRVVDWKPYN